MGTNTLTRRTNIYFDEQKIKYKQQILMYNEQNINNANKSVNVMEQFNIQIYQIGRPHGTFDCI